MIACRQHRVSFTSGRIMFYGSKSEKRVETGQCALYHSSHAGSHNVRDGDFLVVSKTSYSAKRGVPERGQIVILEKKAAEGVSDDNLIARVAGLPGEHVEVRDNKVMIDGREYITENGIKGGTGDINVKLTKDEVFLLCDNRDESADSRNSKLGAVDMKDIKGNVLLRIWPLSGFGGIN